MRLSRGLKDPELGEGGLGWEKFGFVDDFSEESKTGADGGCLMCKFRVCWNV